MKQTVIIRKLICVIIAAVLELAKCHDFEDVASFKSNLYRRSDFRCLSTETVEECKTRYSALAAQSNGKMKSLEELAKLHNADLQQFKGGIPDSLFKAKTTPRFYRRTTPELMSFLNDCDYTIYYCMKTYRTGVVCGKTYFEYFYTFATYCMLDYQNCLEKNDIWTLAYVGECKNQTSSDDVKPFLEYKHYPYENDYFLDQYYPIEYGHPGK